LPGRAAARDIVATASRARRWRRRPSRAPLRVRVASRASRCGQSRSVRSETDVPGRRRADAAVPDQAAGRRRVTRCRERPDRLHAGAQAAGLDAATRYASVLCSCRRLVSKAEGPIAALPPQAERRRQLPGSAYDPSCTRSSRTRARRACAARSRRPRKIFRLPDYVMAPRRDVPSIVAAAKAKRQTRASRAAETLRRLQRLPAEPGGAGGRGGAATPAGGGFGAQCRTVDRQARPIRRNRRHQYR